MSASKSIKRYAPPHAFAFQAMQVAPMIKEFWEGTLSNLSRLSSKYPGVFSVDIVGDEVFIEVVDSYAGTEEFMYELKQCFNGGRCENK